MASRLVMLAFQPSAARRATEYWKLMPSDNLVNSGYCLAQPGREYIVFQKQAQPFTLEIAGAKSPLAAQWFNPQTGKFSAAGAFENGRGSFTPPDGWGSAPQVLHLKAK